MPKENPTPETVSQYTDRELLEYLALNAITTENLLNAIEEQIPGMLAALKEKLDSDPTLRIALKFLPGPK